MKLVLLPGNHEFNAQWSQDVAAALRDRFDVHIQSYRHWTTGKLIDLDFELDRLAETTGHMGEYAVFGKSIGAILAMRGIYEGRISPKKCVFVGVPIRRARHEFDVDRWLGKYDIPTLFIQQTNDPAASYAELVNFLEETKLENYRLVEIPGGDHMYSDIELLKLHTLSFFGLG